MTDEIKNKETEEPEKRIVRIHIDELAVENILREFDAPFPPVSDLDEIHLVIISRTD